MFVEIRIKCTVCPDHLAQNLYMFSQTEYRRDSKSRGNQEDCRPHVDVEEEKTWCLPLLRPNIYSLDMQRSGDTQVFKCNIIMQRNIPIHLRPMVAGGWGRLGRLHPSGADRKLL